MKNYKGAYYERKHTGDRSETSSDKFRSIFRALGTAMLEVNTRGFIHSRLMKGGVMIGLDKNVRLVNMDPYSRMSRNLTGSNKFEKLFEDVKDFKAKKDLGLFRSLFGTNVSTTPTVFITEISGWIYKSFLFWKFETVQEFFIEIDELLRPNNTIFANRGFLNKEFANWKSVVRASNDENMIHCLDYINEGNTDIFQKPFGVLHYFRNFCEYPNGKTEKRSRSATARTKRQAAAVFLGMCPHLVGITYNEIFRLKDEYISTSSRTELIRFQEYMWRYASTFASTFD